VEDDAQKAGATWIGTLIQQQLIPLLTELRKTDHVEVQLPPIFGWEPVIEIRLIKKDDA